jgi:hypothetical protein
MTKENSGGDADRDLVGELQRWEDAGACWRLISRNRGGVTIGLMRCDGGEEVERFMSDDPRLLDFLGDRLTSAD